MITIFLDGSRVNPKGHDLFDSVRRKYLRVLGEFSEIVLVSEKNTNRGTSDANQKLIHRILPNATQGALVSAAFAIEDLTENQSFLIIPSNAIIPIKHLRNFFKSMKDKSLVAGAVVFESTNPYFSYVRKNAIGQIVEVFEKQVSGNCALAGVYYFRNRDIFAECVQWALVNNVTTHGQYYISPALNYFLASALEVGLYEIPSDDYLRFDAILSSEIVESRWVEVDGKI